MTFGRTMALAALLLALPGEAASLGLAEPMRTLNGGVFNHQCVVVNNVLYVISQKGYVAWSKLGGDGDLGPWGYAANLFPEGMGQNYFCAAAWLDRIYVMGGDQSALVVMARAKPDGSLEPWKKTTALPEPRFYGAAVAVGGQLYYVGGQYHRRVFHARILGDGGIGEWKETERLPANRYGMQVFSHGGYLYVVGGTAIKPVDTVFRSKLKADGSLEKWRRTEPLPEPRSGYGGVVAGEDVFVFGGALGNDAELTTSAVATTIGADGHFSAWRELPWLPMAACGLQAVRWRNWIYVVGGITLKEGGNTVWNTVWRYRIEEKTQKGEP